MLYPPLYGLETFFVLYNEACQNPKLFLEEDSFRYEGVIRIALIEETPQSCRVCTCCPISLVEWMLREYQWQPCDLGDAPYVFADKGFFLEDLGLIVAAADNKELGLDEAAYNWASLQQDTEEKYDETLLTTEEFAEAVTDIRQRLLAPWGLVP